MKQHVVLVETIVLPGLGHVGLLKLRLLGLKLELHLPQMVPSRFRFLLHGLPFLSQHLLFCQGGGHRVAMSGIAKAGGDLVKRMPEVSDAGCVVLLLVLLIPVRFHRYLPRRLLPKWSCSALHVSVPSLWPYEALMLLLQLLLLRGRLRLQWL